jgi:hypothetical protein
VVEESDGDLMGDCGILRRRLHRQFGRFLAGQDAIYLAGRETYFLTELEPGCRGTSARQHSAARRTV